MRLGPDFSRFGHKDISCRAREKLNAGQNCFQTVTCFFFYFFSSACFFDITCISSISPQVLANDL